MQKKEHYLITYDQQTMKIEITIMSDHKFVRFPYFCQNFKNGYY